MAGFLVTVFIAGEWFERFGMRHFPAWAGVTLAMVLLSAWRLPDMREPPAASHEARAPIGPVLRQPAVRWFLASLCLVGGPRAGLTGVRPGFPRSYALRRSP